MRRRDFLKGAAACAATPLFGCRSTGCVGQTYPGWQAGEFDIHFIQTGVGEQTFFIFPDGTTLLFDCGDLYREPYLPFIPRRPTPERLGGEWVSRYIRRLVPQRTIDYFVLSHWHADHCGSLSLRSEKTADGRPVCGISRLTEDFDVRHYFNHQYPLAGAYRHDPENEALVMMQDWQRRMTRRCALQTHAFRIGALNQIRPLRAPGGVPGFSVRNLFANAAYWDGKSGVVDYAPVYHRRHPEREGHIPENTLSLGMRFAYGPFRAYFGGDIDDPHHEATLAPLVGPVDVCKTNHHACPSSMGAEFCRAVRAQAYVSSVWSPNQVTDINLVNMSSRELYPGERVLLPGYLPPHKKAEYAGRPFMRDFLPCQGHTVFKVAPGGRTFELFVLTDEDESMTVLHRREFRSGALA